MPHRDTGWRHKVAAVTHLIYPKIWSRILRAFQGATTSPIGAASAGTGNSKENDLRLKCGIWGIIGKLNVSGSLTQCERRVKWPLDYISRRNNYLPAAIHPV